MLILYQFYSTLLSLLSNGPTKKKKKRREEIGERWTNKEEEKERRSGELGLWRQQQSERLSFSLDLEPFLSF